jgi:hypothetical protein
MSAVFSTPIVRSSSIRANSGFVFDSLLSISRIAGIMARHSTVCGAAANGMKVRRNASLVLDGSE